MVMTSMCLHDDMAQSDVNLEAPLQVRQARLGQLLISVFYNRPD